MSSSIHHDHSYSCAICVAKDAQIATLEAEVARLIYERDLARLIYERDLWKTTSDAHATVLEQDFAPFLALAKAAEKISPFLGGPVAPSLIPTYLEVMNEFDAARAHPAVQRALPHPS